MKTDADLFINFSEPVAAFSIDSSTVRLLEINELNQSIDVPVNLKMLSAVELMLRPVNYLKEDTTYTIRIERIRDLSDNQLDSPLEISFRTRKTSPAAFVQLKDIFQTIKRGAYLYIAAGEGGLKIVDASNPSSLKVVSSLSYTDLIRGVAFYGKDKLVIIGGGGAVPGFLRIIDISDPCSPRELRYLGISGRVGAPEAGLPQGYPRSVQINGDYAVVTIFGAFGALEVIDLQKAEQGEMRKSIIGLYQGEWLDDLRLVVDQKKDETGNLINELRAIVLEDYFGLKIINLTRPAVPVEEGSVGLPLRKHLYGLEVVCGYVYDRDADGKLNQEEDEDDDPISSEDELVDLAFFSRVDERKIVIIDITNRSAPSLIGTIELPSDAEVVRQIYLSKSSRKLFVNAGKVYQIDFSQPFKFTGRLDANDDGKDDRIIGENSLKGSAADGMLIDEELGIAYIGEQDRGLTSLRIDGIRLQIVADIDNDKKYEFVEGIFPLGLKNDFNIKNWPAKIY